MKYTLTKTKKLISINDDAINFNASFTITSTKNIPFECIIANQHVLDTTDPSELKYDTFLTTSGEIIVNNNVYQQWYIILRSKEPNEVDVDIHFEKLADYIPQQQQREVINSDNDEDEYETPTHTRGPQQQQFPTKKTPDISIESILYFIIILVLLYFLYQSFNKKSSPSSFASASTTLLDKIRMSARNSSI